MATVEKPIRRRIHFREVYPPATIPGDERELLEWLGEDPTIRRIDDSYAQQEAIKGGIVYLKIATCDIPPDQRELDAETLDRYLRDARKPNRRSWSKKRKARTILVTATADDQAGKKDLYGGTPELIERNAELSDDVANYAEDIKPDRIINLHGGDGIENLFNVPGQRATNDLPLSQQPEALFGLRVTWLEKLGQIAPLDHGTVTSNHGRTRIDYGTAAGNPGDDAGTATERLVNRYLKRAGFDATLVEPDDEYFEWTLFNAFGWVLGLTHGHVIKGGSQGIKPWLKSHDMHRSAFAKSDIAVVAHNHDDFILHGGRGPRGHVRPVIGLPAMDGGSAWFYNMTGADSDPGATTFLIHEDTGYDATSLKRWHRPSDIEMRRSLDLGRAA